MGVGLCSHGLFECIRLAHGVLLLVIGIHFSAYFYSYTLLALIASAVLGAIGTC